MYAVIFNEEDDSNIRIKKFEISGDKTMKLGQFVRRLYHEFDVVDFINYKGDVNEPLNSFDLYFMTFDFNIDGAWVTVRFDINR